MNAKLSSTAALNAASPKAASAFPSPPELTNQAAPKDTDGLSILPALTGGKPTVHDCGFKQALRVGNWKYVKTALYNLAQDRNETTDLAQQFPEIVSRMETLLLSVRTESPDFPVRR